MNPITPMYCCFFSVIDMEFATGNELTFMRLDRCGDFEMRPNSADSEKEEMRYYARTRESVACTVLKIGPGKETTLTCTLLEKEFLCECSWCCKLFPLAMKQCPMCPDQQFTVTRSAGRKHGQSIF